MKKRKIIYILIPILCALVAVLSYVKVTNLNTDAFKFKNEYEKLNGKEISNGLEYKKLSIDNSNPIKYSNYDEIVDVIKNKTGVIYLGFPECPWCRNALPVLLEVAKDNNIDTIYYKNIKDDRDTFEIKDDKAVKTKDGQKGYYKLLKALDDELSDYTLTKDDEVYETGEKRVYAPTVIFVKDGNVVGLHVSTVSSHENPYEDLTDEQHDELYDIYEEYVLDIIDSSCSTEGPC